MLEIKEELDFDDELLVVELDNFKILLCKLGDDVMELELLLVSEDVKEGVSDDISTLEELEDSSQRHSSVGEKLTDERDDVELRGIDATLGR